MSALILGGVAMAQSIDGVAMTDPETVLQQTENRTFDLNMRDANTRRFNTHVADDAAQTRQVEVEFAAAGERAGVPLDVSFARRASLRANRDGDIDGGSSGSELRIGRNLVRRDDARPSDQASVYFFVADDDEALTWSPGRRSGLTGERSGGGLALQEDRVEVGDSAAGITYERNGIQASLAYVERSVSTEVGLDNFTQDESFTGVTVTMRH